MGEEMSGMVQVGGEDGKHPSVEEPVQTRSVANRFWVLRGVSAAINFRSCAVGNGRT